MIQMDLTDIYTIFHPNRKEFTFFLAHHESFSKINHIIGHKANLNRHKKNELPTYIWSDHHELKLDFNNNREKRKPMHSWKPNNSLLIDLWGMEEIRKEINEFLELNENEDTTYPNL